MQQSKSYLERKCYFQQTCSEPLGNYIEQGSIVLMVHTASSKEESINKTNANKIQHKKNCQKFILVMIGEPCPTSKTSSSLVTEKNYFRNITHSKIKNSLQTLLQQNCHLLLLLQPLICLALILFSIWLLQDHH